MGRDIIGDFVLQLSDRVDGYGFFYGTATLGDRTANVNVPPPGEFQGDIELEEPHPTLWRIFVDGEEIRPASQKVDIAPLIKIVMGRAGGTR